MIRPAVSCDICKFVRLKVKYNLGGVDVFVHAALARPIRMRANDAPVQFCDSVPEPTGAIERPDVLHCFVRSPIVGIALFKQEVDLAAQERFVLGFGGKLENALAAEPDANILRHLAEGPVGGRSVRIPSELQRAVLESRQLRGVFLCAKLAELLHCQRTSKERGCFRKRKLQQEFRRVQPLKQGDKVMA